MSKFALKHEPTDFSELLFADAETQKRLQQYAGKLRTKSIILHGDYGTGKSTIAKLLVKARDPVNTGFWTKLNCANDSVAFKSALTGSWRLSEWLGVEPMCVLEEADVLSKKGQFNLRAYMDLYGGMFIITTNHLHAIDKSIQNRCDVIEIVAPPVSVYLPAAHRILNMYGVPMDDIRLAKILRNCGNWRDVLQALEDVVQEYFVRNPQPVAAP